MASLAASDQSGQSSPLVSQPVPHSAQTRQAIVITIMAPSEVFLFITSWQPADLLASQTIKQIKCLWNLQTESF